MELFESHFSLLNSENNCYEKDGVYTMFSGEGIPRHINYSSFKNVFQELVKIKEPIIIETGSSYAGIKSTNLFDSYVKKYGGRLYSVDINAQLIQKIRGEFSEATELICDDSVEFLNEFPINYPGVKPNLVYLDSMDIDWLAPEPAEVHGLNEYLAVKPLLQKGSLLLIDDTPSSPYWLDTREGWYHDLVKYYDENGALPGKGARVVKELAKTGGVDIIHHYYQYFVRFT